MLLMVLISSIIKSEVQLLHVSGRTLLSMVVRMTLTIMVVYGFDHYFGLFSNIDLVDR